MTPVVIVGVGLQLIAERYPGSTTQEPHRVNLGLAILGTENATSYLAKSALFSQTVRKYGQLFDQQHALCSQQLNSSTSVIALDNMFHIVYNLFRLRRAVQGDNLKTQAIHRVIGREI